MANNYFSWASEDDGSMRRKVQFEDGTVGEDVAVGGVVMRQIGKNFSTFTGRDAQQVLAEGAKPTLSSQPVSPAPPAKPALPSEPVAPAVSAPMSVASLPTPDSLTPSMRRQFNRVEQREGTSAANKTASRRFSARPIPSWANTDNLNTRDTVSPIGSTEPGSYEIRGKSPGDLATNFRRKLQSAKAGGDNEAFSELRKYQSFLLDG
jgi:hypothetical protein